MQKIIIITAIAFASLTSFAQKNFEGVIDYVMKAKDSTPVLHIKTTFLYPQIKMQTTVLKLLPGADVKNEIIIVDFSKGTISRVKAEDKKVEIESMKGSGKKEDIPFLKPDSSLTKTIAGHTCTAYTTGEVTRMEEKDSTTVTTKANITIWYAGDLYYKVPDDHKRVQMIPLLTNRNIALGSSIRLNAAGHELNLVTMTEQIVPQRVQKSVFRLPAGYKIRHNK